MTAFYAKSAHIKDARNSDTLHFYCHCCERPFQQVFVNGSGSAYSQWCRTCLHFQWTYEATYNKSSIFTSDFKSFWDSLEVKA